VSEQQRGVRKAARNAVPHRSEHHPKLPDQDSAPRHIDLFVGSDAVTSLSVAGHGQNLVEYLDDVAGKVSAMTTSVLETIDYILPNGVPSLRPVRKDDMQ
jgi:hypothetical protein